MFTHVVFFKLVERSSENLNKVKNILLTMKDNIPQLEEIEIGIDELNTERSFDICLITKFKNKDDYEVYALSEYHVNQVLIKIKPLILTSKVVDYIC